MRPIDADYIRGALETELCREDDGLEDRQWAYGYAAGVDLAICKLAEAPTLTPPNETEYRGYTCKNCWHTWLEDRDASDYPEYCPGCGVPLHKEENDPLTLEQLRASPHGKIRDSTLQSICNRANEIACRPPEGEVDGE